MRILVFMPRNMRFGPTNATSIDLCVRDLIVNSRYRDTTTVVCCQNESLFDDVRVRTYPPEVDVSRRRKAAFAIEEAVRMDADAIVVQQHLPTAAALAQRVDVPVILHRHNMTKGIRRGGIGGALQGVWRERQYRGLAGMIFVSDACRDDFRVNFPDVPPALAVVPNGLDFSAWMPSASRKREVICVGRAAPEKGIVETAEAMAAFLAKHPDWRGRLIVSEPNRFPGYTQMVMQAIAPVRQRVEISLDQPLAEVCARYREAAIAVVASRWTEPFGRAALEAHAAGCAVISSGTGGLREISGDEALMLPADFTSADIADRVEILARDETLRNGFAARGRMRCQERFAIREVSAAADSFYERVVNAEDHSRSSVRAARRVARSDDCSIVGAAVKTSPT